MGGGSEFVVNGSLDIAAYLQTSLDVPSNRSDVEMGLMSFGFFLYTIIGALGNGLVLLALSLQRKWSGLDNVMLVFIFNLTVSDLLVCVITFPATAISAAVDNWILGPEFCWVCAVCVTYLRITAILFMTMICVHRVIVIKYPFDEIITESRSRIICVAVWVFASAPQIIPFFGIDPYHYDPIRAICIADFEYGKEASTSRIRPSTISALIYIFIPMIIITGIYSKILLIAIGSLRNKSKMNVSRGTKKTKGSKAIVTTVVLVGSFILCFLPFLIFAMIISATEGDVITPAMIIYGEFSSSLHCVLNPFIYFYTNRTFRAFMLSPFKGTFVARTEFFAKNAYIGTTRVNLYTSTTSVSAGLGRQSSQASGGGSRPGSVTSAPTTPTKSLYSASDRLALVKTTRQANKAAAGQGLYTASKHPSIEEEKEH